MYAVIRSGGLKATRAGRRVSVLWSVRRMTERRLRKNPEV